MLRRENAILAYIRGKDVLDVGSIGQTTAYCLWDLLKEHAGRLTGIDLADAPAEAAAQFGLARDQLPKDGRIVKGNMETYDFGRQFEVVVCGDVLEHVENQGLFLRNIHRHLKPDGHLILTTPNAGWPHFWVTTNPTHTLWHDRTTIRRILSLCGFRIVTLRHYSGNDARYGPLSRLVGLRRAMLIVCQPVQAPSEGAAHGT